MGIELLPARDPRRSDCGRHRRPAFVGIRGLFGRFAARGLRRTGDRARDRSPRRPRGAGALERRAGGRSRPLAVSHDPARAVRRLGAFSASACRSGFTMRALPHWPRSTVTRRAGPITGITLFAGFASTVSWPLSTFLNDAVGWRETVLVWAALNIVIGLPLNLLLPVPQRLRQAMRPADAPRPAGSRTGRCCCSRSCSRRSGSSPARWRRTCRACSRRAGATPVQAIAAAALVGPAQVAARLVEFFLLRRTHPLMSARVAAVLHPVGAVVLALGGAPMATAFVDSLRRRQRPSHHRARHGAARGVRPGRLWRAHRAAWRAGPRGAGVRAAAVRAAARRHGSVRHCGVERALPCGACRAVLRADVAARPALKQNAPGFGPGRCRFGVVCR